MPNDDIQCALRIITRVWSSYDSKGQTKFVWFLYVYLMKIDVGDNDGQNERSLNCKIVLLLKETSKILTVVVSILISQKRLFVLFVFYGQGGEGLSRLNSRNVF